MTLRIVSLMSLAGGILVPAIGLVYARYRFGGYFFSLEGKEYIIGFLLMIWLSIFLCAVGVALNAITYGRLPPPRPFIRKVELALFFLPMIAWMPLFGPLYNWPAR